MADDALPRKPWPSGGRDSHPATLLLPPGSALEAAPRDLTAPLLRGLYARLPPTPLSRVTRRIGGRLSPVHFRGLPARQVSCYALLRGWLLLSLPPCCLSGETPFGLALSLHFGALTPVWVVPLSVVGLTPTNPSPGFFCAGTFGVRKGGGTFRSLATPSVLYRAGSICRGLTGISFGGN